MLCFNAELKHFLTMCLESKHKYAFSEAGNSSHSSVIVLQEALPLNHNSIHFYTTILYMYLFKSQFDMFFLILMQVFELNVKLWAGILT